MANPNRPNGLEPVGQPLRVNIYTSSAAVYPGDPVSADSSGRVARAAPSATLQGVAVSYASAADQEVLVADHPDQYFKVQADDSAIAAQTAVNLNYNLAATSAAFSTVYKLSRVQLDASTGGSTSASATLPLKLLGISREVNNSFGDKVKCVVRINNHKLAGGTGTVGI